MCTCEEPSVISLISINACIFKKLQRNKDEKGATKVQDKGAEHIEASKTQDVMEKTREEGQLPF